jgi:hypothetical protein
MDSGLVHDCPERIIVKEPLKPNGGCCPYWGIDIDFNMNALVSAAAFSYGFHRQFVEPTYQEAVVDPLAHPTAAWYEVDIDFKSLLRDRTPSDDSIQDLCKIRLGSGKASDLLPQNIIIRPSTTIPSCGSVAGISLSKRIRTCSSDMRHPSSRSAVAW